MTRRGDRCKRRTAYQYTDSSLSRRFLRTGRRLLNLSIGGLLRGEPRVRGFARIQTGQSDPRGVELRLELERGLIMRTSGLELTGRREQVAEIGVRGGGT